MTFRFSSLYFHKNEITSEIIKTDTQQLLVHEHLHFQLYFAYKIETVAYEPYFMNSREEKDQFYDLVLQYSIYVKDSNNDIWESSFIKDTTHILENFYLADHYNSKINPLILYQDLDHETRHQIEQNVLTSLYVSNDNRCYHSVVIRGQETSIGAKYGCIDFKIYAETLKKEQLHTAIDIDSPNLYLRADESDQERFVKDNYIFPERLQYGSYEVLSLCNQFENPIHQVLNDSLVNQFYSYFSRKKLNTLTFSKSTEVIEELPICFKLVNEKDFKPDFIG